MTLSTILFLLNLSGILVEDKDGPVALTPVPGTREGDAFIHAQYFARIERRLLPLWVALFPLCLRAYRRV